MKTNQGQCGNSIRVPMKLCAFGPRTDVCGGVFRSAYSLVKSATSTTRQEDFRLEKCSTPLCTSACRSRMSENCGLYSGSRMELPTLNPINHKSTTAVWQWRWTFQL